MSSNLLNVPETERQQFSTNFLNQVVAEFKFPVLLEISETKPIEIQKAIRSELPNYESAQNTELLIGGGTKNTFEHKFFDRKKDYIVTLSENSLSVSCNNYTCYEKFKEKCEFVVKTILPFLETDFYTRFGLRYINILNTPNIRNELSDWINEELILHVASGVLGSVLGLKMEVHGKVDNEDSVYAFRCGLIDSASQTINLENNVNFILDYDYSKTDVDEKDVFTLMDSYHEIHFNFFMWCLGNKAKLKLEGKG